MIGFNGMYANNYPAYNTPYANQVYQDRMAQIQNAYQQALPQAAINQQQTQNQGAINQGLLWVQGEAGAKAYLMAPNTTVLLMDSENERFYIKSTDGAGMPNLRVFEYREMHPNTQPVQNTEPINIDPSKFVEREEFEEIKKQYNDLMKRLESYELQQAEESKKAKKTGGNVDG